MIMAIQGILVFIKLSERTAIWSIPLVQKIALITAITGTAVTLLIFLITRNCKRTLSLHIAYVVLSYAYAFGVTFGLVILIGVNP